MPWGGSYNWAAGRGRPSGGWSQSNKADQPPPPAPVPGQGGQGGGQQQVTAWGGGSRSGQWDNGSGPGHGNAVGAVSVGDLATTDIDSGKMDVVTPETDKIIAGIDEEQKKEDDARASEDASSKGIMSKEAPIISGGFPPPAPGETGAVHAMRIMRETLLDWAKKNGVAADESTPPAGIQNFAQNDRGVTSIPAFMSPEHTADDQEMAKEYNQRSGKRAADKQSAEAMRGEEAIRRGATSAEQQQYQKNAASAQGAARSAVMSNRGVGGAMARRMANRVGAYVGSRGNQGERLLSLQRKLQAVQRWAQWALSREQDQNSATANQIRMWAQQQADALQKDIQTAQENTTTGFGRYVGGALGAAVGFAAGGVPGAAAGWQAGSQLGKATENAY